MPDTIRFIDRATLERTLSWTRAIDALDAALVSGAAPGNTPQRTFAEVSGGQLILMPGEVGSQVGVKVVSVSPGNAARGLPRIQGLHIAFDGSTLRPVAVIDAESLTLRRTASLSALAVRRLATADSKSLLVFGTGPQAFAHALAINAVRPLDQVVVVGRRAAAVAGLIGELEARGIPARSGTPEDVAAVDLVACCTTATEPLFDSRLLRPAATVVAVGSHEPDVREVDTNLVRRATVVVESRPSALGQAGDIILAIGDGVPGTDAITADLGELVRGELEIVAAAPRLFKSVGEAWCDVVVATAAIQAC
ncbi:ornithine cyclodeaminase family protein [Kribbella shirazensis]|uniref:Ornithine cyclodeaminase n=1 Tax=Kribbella shirazensis TaxID=1105143 RepID=A0A7X6A487_9ACTN|nr:ornithine cyclodeaminase family protein [Kribbella shirazensis]NIK60723.1 ornithine cyclodeaminase [Kribbella shirazensis]